MKRFKLKKIIIFFSLLIKKVNSLKFWWKSIKEYNNIIKKTIDPIKFLYFLLEKTKNNKIERKVIYHEIISINYYNKIINVINNNDNYALNILKVMIKCRYLSKIEKEKLIYIFNNLKNK